MNDVFVTTADWRTGKALRDIRQRVFIDEQQVPEDLEWDALDETATHFLLYRAEQPVGTGRLLADGHIGRIAILPEHRGAGLGDQLMRAIIEHAQAQGMDELLLSAQTHAIAFYQRLGFSVCSDVYLDAGIDHQDMCWQARDQVQAPLLDIEFVSPGRFSILNPDTDSEAPARYPDDDPALTPLNESNAQSLLSKLVTGCRQQLLVFAPEQAAWLFQRRDFIRNQGGSDQFALQELTVQRGGRPQIGFIRHPVDGDLQLQGLSKSDHALDHRAAAGRVLAQPLQQTGVQLQAIHGETAHPRHGRIVATEMISSIFSRSNSGLPSSSYVVVMMVSL